MGKKKKLGKSLYTFTVVGKADKAKATRNVKADGRRIKWRKVSKLKWRAYVYK